MDHDVLHRDVQKLKDFNKRVEAAIAFIEYMQKLGLDPAALAKLQTQAAQPGTVGMSDSDRALLKATLDGYSDRLSKLESSFSESGITTDLASRISKLEQSAADSDAGGALDQRLQVLEARMPQDLVDRVTAALDWLDDNRDGLEVLLSLDGDPDAEDGPKPPAETPPAGPTDGQGAPAAEPAVDGAKPDDKASPVF
jgi:hypothetical protein